MKRIAQYPEILAPAGDMTALEAAVYHGADAVYLGLSGGFNARAKAHNFDFLKLREAIEFAHLFGVRVYIAFNTLIKSCELDIAVDSIRQAADLGADAFILQDLGLLSELSRRGIRAEFHASTQLGIHNADGAVWAEKCGFSRIILSRETTLDDIAAIRKATNLEIEFFVHGALCVAFSGNCYFSSLIAGESGNRGRCLQFCRKQYTLKAAAEKNAEFKGYLLSPKDLNLSARLKELRNAGVDSFKIEGRLRRPEYVGEAVRVYKKALNDKITQSDADSLNIMFNRGNGCDGYSSDPTASVIDPKHPAHIGVSIGFVKRADRYAEIRYKANAPRLEKNDGVKFMRDGIEVGSASIGNPSKITFVGNVQTGDEIRLTSRARLNSEVLSARKKIMLCAKVEIAVGQPVRYKLSDGEVTISAISESKVQESITAPLLREKLDFLFATGDDYIVISDKTLILNENCFISVSILKDLRRNAVGLWRAEKLKQYAQRHSACQAAPNFPFDSVLFLKMKKTNPVFVMVGDEKALTEELLGNCDFAVLNPSEYSLERINRFVAAAGKKAVLNLPNIARVDDCAILREIVQNAKIDCYIVNNVYGLELCRHKNIVLGVGMNCLNMAYGYAVTRVASIESEKPQRGIINYIYGRIPLMTLSFCPERNFLGSACENCKKCEFCLIDERAAHFPLRRKKIANCYYELLNGLPLDNREVLQRGDCGALIDLTFEPNPVEALAAILSERHSSLPHMHGNYKKGLS